MAPHAGRGVQPRRVQGPLAARARLRALLRVARRRDEQLVSGPRPRQPPDRPAGDARGGLPPLRRPVGQGDRVHPRREGRRSRQAVLHVLRAAGRSRAAPRADGVGRQVQGPFDEGYEAIRAGILDRQKELGLAARRHRALADQPARRARTHRSRRPAVAAARHRSAVGLAERRRAAPVRPDGRGVRRLHLVLPTTSSAGCSTTSRTSGPARQHDHRRRSPTTAPAARAVRTARSTSGGSSTALADTTAVTLQHIDELGTAAVVQPLQHRVGVGVRHAVPVLEAVGRLRGRRRRHVHRVVARTDRADPTPRQQYIHAVDVVPTVYELLGIEPPAVHQGLPAEPDRGRELRGGADRRRRRPARDAVLRDARPALDLPRRLARVHRAPADLAAGASSTRTCGSCTTSNTDRAQSKNLAADEPERLEPLKELWFYYAGIYNGLPLDDRTALEQVLAERPHGAPDRPRVRVLPRLRRRSRVRRRRDQRPLVHDRGRRRGRIRRDAEGVLYAHGGVAGGHSLYVKDKRCTYAFNWVGTHLQNDRRRPRPHARPPRPRRRLRGARARTPIRPCPASPARDALHRRRTRRARARSSPSPAPSVSSATVSASGATARRR